MEDLTLIEKNENKSYDLTLSLIEREDLNGAEEVSSFLHFNYISDILITFCHTFELLQL